MRRLAPLLAAMALAASASAPAAAGEGFGLKNLDVAFTDQEGSPSMFAGTHPFAVTFDLDANTEELPGGEIVAIDAVKDIVIEQPPGFAGDPTAVPRCPAAVFLEEVGNALAGCPDETALGKTTIRIGEDGEIFPYDAALYNLLPPPGALVKLGFIVAGVPVTLEVGLSDAYPFNPRVTVSNISQAVEFHAASTTVWGNPASSAHDAERGRCMRSPGADKCPVSSLGARPFITSPRSCAGPLLTRFEADSWEDPGVWVGGSALTHDDAEPPNPLGLSECGKLGFGPEIDAQPTSAAATSPSGLDFSLDVNDEGIGNPTGTAQSDVRKAVVTLPEGMSANPSLAEGLGVCSEAGFEAETVSSEPGEGCPQASKVGSVEVESPLLEDQLLKGQLFVAEPYENPFDSLLALYMVVRDPALGVLVKLPGKVEPDPQTGRLTTTFGEEPYAIPQFPISHFRLHFREGARSPLATPPACGTYDVEAELHPWSGGAPLITTSAFQIITGPNEGPCPKGGLPPLKPGLLAGTVNNRAGSFSPFNVRISRTDAEQEITRFSIKLPPGITAKLAGVPYCPDAAIAAAKARTGPHGGAEELASPSCPAASEVGRSLAGAGVGPALAYAPGKVYLAGPYNGSNLSIVAITAGVVGPFDIGTVVIRQALKIDPETAEVFIDSTGSDPIPHIIQGIPVHLRDIRAYVDKPDFVLNPTDCTRTSTASTVLGAGLDFVSQADDNPFTATSPFQAADCAALPFKPQLGIRLIGGTRRGAFPKFTAHLEMNGIGEAGIAQAQVTLPKSAFVEQAHFKTICTRVQFKEGDGNGSNCPPGSIYGKARAVTPILAEPLEGPVFLRANGGERDLPDLVVALGNSQVDFNLVGFVDSVKGKLRNTFQAAPDAPVTSFDIELEGGQKGLFVNSRNLCARKYRALAGFIGQNGKSHVSKPLMKVKCKKKAKGKAAKRHKRHKRAAGNGARPPGGR